MTGKVKTAGTGGDWPYHMNRNTKKMVRCKSNPCSRHKQGEDVMAASLEDAYRKYNQGNDASGLSSVGGAVASGGADTKTDRSRLSDCFLDGLVESVSRNPDAARAIEDATRQIEAIRRDGQVDDATALDYASYLDDVVNASFAGDRYAHTHGVSATRRGYETAEAAVHDAPARFVLDDSESGFVSGRLTASDGASGTGDCVAAPEHLLRYFGRGQVKSAAAIRAISSPAPGRLQGGMWVDAIDSHSDSRESMTPKAAMLEAARHPWGGVVLKGVRSESFTANRMMGESHPPRDRVAAELLVKDTGTMLSAGSVADSLTARDYESFHPSGDGMPDPGEHDTLDHSVMASYEYKIKGAFSPVDSESASEVTSADIKAAAGGPVAVRRAFDSKSRGGHPALRRRLIVRATAAANAIHTSRKSVCEALMHSVDTGDREPLARFLTATDIDGVRATANAAADVRPRT